MSRIEDAAEGPPWPGMDGDIEATALCKAARLLEQVRDDWDGAGHAPRLEHAVRYNQRLWSLFRTELEEDPDRIPALRTELLRLSAEVERHSVELVARPARETLEILIAIDQRVAAGAWSPDA